MGRTALPECDDRFLLRFYHHMFRIVHVFKSQLLHAVREGGREQHVETIFGLRHTAEQETNVFNKAEIKHAICFIQYHCLNVIEVEYTLFVEIDNAAGGPDQNIDATLQFCELLIIAFATISQGCFQTSGGQQRLGIIKDLNCQFASRGHNNGAWLSFCSAFSGWCGQ